MTSNLKDAIDDRPDATTGAQLDLEEKCRMALKQILTHARRAPDTPLRFGIDSEGIIHAVLNDLYTAQAEEDAGSSPDWEMTKAVFDVLLKQALLDEPQRRAGLNRPLITEQPYPSINAANGVSGRAGVRVNKKAQHPLAVWLERFYTAMRGVHPDAIEIVSLRTEDFTSREIAQRLGIGLRLVMRITEDIRLTLAGEVNT